MQDDHFATLNRTQLLQKDYELALRVAPFIRFDSREPFFPLAVGYTVFRESTASPSFARELRLPEGAVCGVEYAVWWDWDIQHLYELEHIWVYLDADDRVIAAEASWHGGYHEMRDANGNVPLQDGRLVIYSEPGKHAFAPEKNWLLQRAEITRANCGRDAGKGGVWITPLFRGKIRDRDPLNNQLVWTFLERQAFIPTFEFDRLFDLAQVAHVPWPHLNDWIPGRVHWWVKQLEHEIPFSQRRVMRIAHRGASAYAQENSFAAIEKAAALGADMIEVDVRLTADGIPVIAHDENLERVFGVNQSLSAITFKQLQSITPTGYEPVRSLAQMGRFCYDLGLGLYLDIKEGNEAALETMLIAVRESGLFGGTIWGSFRVDWLAEIKSREPDALTSVLFSSLHVDPVALAQAVKCDFVHPCWERYERPDRYLTQHWLERVRAHRLGVVCWHEERPTVIRALHQLGVTAICSDEPERLQPETN